MPLDDVPLETSVYDTPGKASYDPETVHPISSSPAPSSSAPGTFGGTSGADGEQPKGEPRVKEQEALPEFDPRHIEEFKGLLYIGALTDTFEWLGHRFVIRTLTTGELAEVAMAIKPYAGSDIMTKAYQAAVVAGSVISVDGQTLPIPLTNEPGDTKFANAFRYVMRSWFPPVLDVIYERYYALEITVREVIEDMGKVSG